MSSVTSQNSLQQVPGFDSFNQPGFLSASRLNAIEIDEDSWSEPATPVSIQLSSHEMANPHLSPTHHGGITGWSVCSPSFRSHIDVFTWRCPPPQTLKSNIYQDTAQKEVVFGDPLVLTTVHAVPQNASETDEAINVVLIVT